MTKNDTRKNRVKKMNINNIFHKIISSLSLFKVKSSIFFHNFLIKPEKMQLAKRKKISCHEINEAQWSANCFN